MRNESVVLLGSRPTEPVGKQVEEDDEMTRMNEDPEPVVDQQDKKEDVTKRKRREKRTDVEPLKTNASRDEILNHKLVKERGVLFSEGKTKCKYYWNQCKHFNKRSKGTLKKSSQMTARRLYKEHGLPICHELVEKIPSEKLSKMECLYARDCGFRINWRKKMIDLKKAFKVYILREDLNWKWSVHIPRHKETTIKFSQLRNYFVDNNICLIEFFDSQKFRLQLFDTDNIEILDFENDANSIGMDYELRVTPLNEIDSSEVDLTNETPILRKTTLSKFYKKIITFLDSFDEIVSNELMITDDITNDLNASNDNPNDDIDNVEHNGINDINHGHHNKNSSSEEDKLDHIEVTKFLIKKYLRGQLSKSPSKISVDISYNK